MARADELGSLQPALVTAGLTLVFAAWAAYGFSGARIAEAPAAAAHGAP